MADPGDGFAVFHRVSGGRARRRLLLPQWGLLLPQWRAARERLWLVTVALPALALTVVLQQQSVTVYTPSGHTMVATTTALIGVLAAIVFAQRMRYTRHARDLVMAVAFAILSATDLFLAAGPTGANSSSWERIILAIRLTGAAVLIGATFWPHVHLDDFRGLPTAMVTGVVVLALASFNYILVPSLHSDRLNAGDILKLGAYLLILYGCLIGLRDLQRRLVQRVGVAERRRVARDMHDGLAQELAFIAVHSQRLGQGADDDAATAAHLRAAAERALHDSRTMIAVLISPNDVPLDQLIRRTVESFRSRFGVEVDLELDGDVVVDAERRNALLHILHEALTNAIRHGSAGRILVSLTGGRGGPSLRIADDGSGFDVPTAVRSATGLGLISMGERAELLGGGLDIFSRPGAGTIVQVGLP
jgi:signal transduction histidine kinase